mmetsp:Transcript_37295/g.81658  ORF Transcript_37295/g.81658 Transcript_37295/m.81658 type:complete len:112 (-) Transcript_37295:996-1331(-)
MTCTSLVTVEASYSRERERLLLQPSLAQECTFATCTAAESMINNNGFCRCVARAKVGKVDTYLSRSTSYAYPLPHRQCTFYMYGRQESSRGLSTLFFEARSCVKHHPDGLP